MSAGERRAGPGMEVPTMVYRFNPPPGWDVPAGFTPEPDWRPDASWPSAPADWEFWLPEPVGPPPPPGEPKTPAEQVWPAAQAAGQKVGGMLRSLRAKAEDEDWAGKAKVAAGQAASAAKDAGAQLSAKSREHDQASLDKLGPLPEGALWRGISHEPGRNAVVTLFPDRIERHKAAGRMSLTGLLAPGPQDVEVIPTRSISSVQVTRGSWYHDVTIYASGNTIVLSVDASAAETLREAVMEQVLGRSEGAAPATAAASAPAGPDVLDQIRRLGDLRDAGLLTDAEFEAKKADLLDRI